MGGPLRLTRLREVGAPIHAATVLIVTPSAIVADDLVRWQHTVGRVATQAPDGADCLDILDRRPHQMDLVLIDATLPDIEIPDLLRMIRTVEVVVPILVAGTACAPGPIRRRIMLAGADDVLPSHPTRPVVKNAASRMIARYVAVRTQRHVNAAARPAA